MFSLSIFCRSIPEVAAFRLSSELKSKIDTVGEAFYTGGISNPLEAIEQTGGLLFLRRLDDE